MDLFYRNMFSFFLVKYLKVGFLGHTAGVFLRNCQVFPQQRHHLHPHLPHISVSPHFHHHVVSALVLVGILVGVQWYPTVYISFFFLYISLMTNDIEHILFPVLICILISSLLTLPFKCLAYIFFCPYCLFFLSWKGSAYIWIQSFIMYLSCKYFPPSL